MSKAKNSMETKKIFKFFKSPSK